MSDQTQTLKTTSPKQKEGKRQYIREYMKKKRQSGKDIKVYCQRCKFTSSRLDQLQRHDRSCKERQTRRLHDTSQIDQVLSNLQSCLSSNIYPTVHKEGECIETEELHTQENAPITTPLSIRALRCIAESLPEQIQRNFAIAKMIENHRSYLLAKPQDSREVNQIALDGDKSFKCQYCAKYFRSSKLQYQHRYHVHGKGSSIWRKLIGKSS